ncbi:Uncharacterised protein [Clostridioides difficile]|nr:Uncharacterised protein [Clostridioides difficile]
MIYFYSGTKFTYHIVNIKLDTDLAIPIYFMLFTYHIINIKPCQRHAK